MSRHRTRLAVVVTSVLSLCLGTWAWADWTSAAHGTAGARTAIVPAPSAPAVTAVADGVTVSWEGITVADVAATVFRLERVNTVSGAVRAATGGCAGEVTALTCVDDAVPPGSWRYRVRAVLGPWTGGWSASSAPVTVEGSTTATFAITPASAVPGDPVTVAGTGWPADETVTVEVATSNLCTATTDNAGAFSTSCTAPSLARGSYSTGAHGGDVVVSGAAFDIVPGVREVTPVASEGGTVRARGRGFAGNSPVLIWLDHYSPQQLATTNQSGDTSTLQVPVPAGLGAGEHVLHLRDEAGNEATATFSVLGADLQANPAEGPVGGSVHLTGAHWPPGGTVNVSIRSTPMCTPVADASGVLDARCDLPVTNGGTTPIVATSSGVRREVEFTVLSSLSPSTPTTSSGATVNLTGRGFGAHQAATITIDGTTVAPVRPFNTGDRGSFVATITVPPLGAGTHEVRVTDTMGFTAATTVTVVEPTITMSATASAPSSTIQVSGANWPGSATVGVSIGGGQACLFTVNAQGSFGPGNCTVSALVPGGTHAVTASGGGAMITLPAAFTVLPQFRLGQPRVSPGQAVTLSGVGLPASSDVRFSIGGIEVATARSDSYGHATNVRAVVPSLPAGTHAGVVNGSLGSSAPLPIAVFLPTFDIDADVIRPQRTAVRLTGAGWPASAQVTFRVGNQTFCGGLWTTAAGDLNGTCTPQNLPGGEQVVTATVDHVYASTTVAVDLSITLNASSTRAGQAVAAVSRGLVPGRDAQLLVGGTVVATGRSGTDGTWAFTYTVPAGTPAGPLEWTVRQEGMTPASVVIPVTT